MSRGLNRIDVVAVNRDGDVQRIKYIDGVWAAPLTIRGGHPVAGLKHSTDEDYIGPAIASRGADLLDVFVVDDDGLLAVTTWANGNWGAWQTLAGRYNVTARPAAVALSATDVRLAINASDVLLYEPLATFGAGAPVFVRGNRTGTTAHQAPPTLTLRNGEIEHYRVLIANSQGRISHRLESGTWMDVGGIPKPGTGISAVATGDFTFMALMNGEDAIGCNLSCPIGTAGAPRGGGQFKQPGGLWIRYFQ